MAQLSIDPKIWARTRREAFDRGISASRLVEELIMAHFEGAENGGGEDKPRGWVADEASSSNSFLDLRDLPPGVKTVFEDPDTPPPIVTIIETPAIEMEAIIVSTPEEAATAAVALAKHPFTPVPKPAPRKPRGRRVIGE